MSNSFLRVQCSLTLWLYDLGKCLQVPTFLIYKEGIVFGCSTKKGHKYEEFRQLPDLFLVLTVRYHDAVVKAKAKAEGSLLILTKM